MPKIPARPGHIHAKQAAMASMDLGRGVRSAAPVGKAVDLLRKVLSNIIKQPAEAKFRSLKLPNKAVAKHLVPLPGLPLQLRAQSIHFHTSPCRCLSISASTALCPSCTRAASAAAWRFRLA
eukprot:SAG22_NODE_6874_length_800_cov_3.811698_2_plen_122_part_00